MQEKVRFSRKGNIEMLKYFQEKTKNSGKVKIELLNLILEVVLARDLGWLAEPDGENHFIIC